MSMNEPTITVHGRLTADPDMKMLDNGAVVVEFTVAQNPRYRMGDGTWRDGDPVFLRCKAWRQLGENAVESIHKGHLVTVTGRVRARRWQDKDTGQNREMLEVECDDVSVSLRNQRARVVKVERAKDTDQPQSAPEAEPEAEPEAVA